MQWITYLDSHIVRPCCPFLFLFYLFFSVFFFLFFFFFFFFFLFFSVFSVFSLLFFLLFFHGNVLGRRVSNIHSTSRATLTDIQPKI